MDAVAVFAGIVSTGIVIITIPWVMHAGGAIEGIDGAGIAIIAVCCGIVADSLIAVIVCVRIAVIANLRLMLAFFAIETIHGAGITIIAAWWMMPGQSRLGCR